MQRRLIGFEPVQHRVLHQRLQQQHRHFAIGDVAGHDHFMLEAVAEAHLLQREIALRESDFFADRNDVAAVFGQRRVQQLGQLLDRGDGFGCARVDDQRGNPVQRVVQKVRMHARAQHRQLRRLQLRFEL